MLIFAIEMKKEHQKLLETIEKEVGKKLLTPKDFEWLSAKVETRTKEHLSESTLMRLWGYEHREHSHVAYYKAVPRKVA